MKKRTILFIVLLTSFGIANSQVKVWNKELKSEKSKGIYSKLEQPEILLNQDYFAFIEPTTIAATLIPYAIKYGNYALKRTTSKNEADYIFESACLNQQIFSYSPLKDSIVNIKALQLFYKKGKNKQDTLAVYSFIFRKLNSQVEISLDKVVENYSSVKMKRKYDLLISNFDISVSALITEEIDSVTSVQKIMDLGTRTIHKINPSFKKSNVEYLNKAGVLLPSVTKEGKEIKVEKLIIKISIKHVNPIGTTSSKLNDFLENNSDTNEEFLNSILIKKEEDKEE